MTIERRGAPTLEAVASLAGVSRATVSRVVNGSTTVSQPIATAVRAAIAELGYVPNRAARSLASQRSQSIALVIPEDMSRFFGDLFFAAVVAGIDSRLGDSDFVLNLMIADHDTAGKTQRFLTGGAVDGAIVVSHHTSDRFLKQIADTLPTVFSGRSPVHRDDAYVVDVDNVAGGALATQRLIDRGCRRIAMVTGPLTMPSALDRIEGWRRAIDAAGVEAGPVVDGDFTMLGGARAIRELLEDSRGFDGVFISSDLMASGAIPVLQDRGIRVPEDLLLVGYDNSPAATSTDVKLTTVSQPSKRMGWEMADILLDVLQGRTDRKRVTTFPTELVVRDSA